MGHLNYRPARKRNDYIYFKNTTKEQDKGEAQCQSACLKPTIYKATFLGATGSVMRQRSECLHNMPMT